MKNILFFALFSLFFASATAQLGATLSPGQVAVLVDDDVQQAPLVVNSPYDVVIDKIRNNSYEVPRHSTDVVVNQVGVISTDRHVNRPTVNQRWYMKGLGNDQATINKSLSPYIAVRSATSGGLSRNW